MTEELKQAAQMALEALSCTGEDDDPGHRCGRCDDYVDRNGHVREALRAAISQAQGGTAGEAVAWRIHPHDYGIGSAGVYAMTQIPQRVDAWLKKGWTPEPLYTHPAPGVPEDVVRDAERYRWLRDRAPWTLMSANGIVRLAARLGTDFVPSDDETSDELDAAIDAAMLAAAPAQKGADHG